MARQAQRIVYGGLSRITCRTISKVSGLAARKWSPTAWIVIRSQKSSSGIASAIFRQVRK